MTKVEGNNRGHKVVIYTISTCGWCKKMKRLLQEMDIEYEYIDIDTLEGEEQDLIREEIRKHNPRISTPTLVIDDGKEVIIGFDEDKVRGVFKSG